MYTVLPQTLWIELLSSVINITVCTVLFEKSFYKSVKAIKNFNGQIYDCFCDFC